MRLTRNQVSEVMKRGTRASGVLSEYRFLKKSTSGFTVVVSKKVGATAVSRNRIKRRMRAALASALPSPFRSHVVLIAKGAAREASVLEFEEEFKKKLSHTV